MTKQLIPFATNDISALSRTLREQLAQLEHAPSHVEMLNILARAGGHKNFQHLRADAERQQAPQTPALPTLSERVEKVIRHFDAQGVMQRWPGKTNHQDLCLWAIWARIPAAEDFSEREINGFIIAAHSFGDHALLRRSLVDAHMLGRTPGGRSYTRIEKQPDADAIALLAALRAIAPGGVAP